MRQRRVAFVGLATFAVLAALVTLHVMLFAFATLVTDSGRDLANAFAIGHGGPYPQYGPALFGRWQLGPVWFWLLALPLRLGGSITAASLFVGALATAKIPLAYLIGKRMLDVRLGLIAALFVALPGWSSVGALVIAHTSVVESAMLATFWLALVAWQERRAGVAVAACLMLALALHAHPTALIAAPAVALTLWRAVLMPRRWGWLVAGIALFLLPFLPALLAEMHSGWPQASASLAYLSEADAGARLAHLPQVGWALVTGGAWFAGHFLLPAPAGSLWWLAHGLVLVATTLGALRLALARDTDDGATALRWLLIVIVWGAASIAFIVLLRDATPTWMIYCLAPFGAFALALGMYGLLHERRNADIWLVLLTVATLGVNLVLLQQRTTLEHSGQVLLPGGNVGNITTPRNHPATRSPWLSVRQFDALAKHACAIPGQFALHGELAATFDFAQGVATGLHCPTQQLPRLGGIAADRHLAGIAAGLAAELGLDPAPQDFGHVLRVPTQVLAPAQGRDADVDVRYRIDRQSDFDTQGDTELSGSLTCPSGDVLAITNLMPLLNRFTHHVYRNGTPLAPLAESRTTAYYRCDDSELHWRIRTPDAVAADVFVIRLRSP